jgi:predicted nucleotidyltransferase
MAILHKDLKEFLGLLNGHKVRYLIVGGYAVGIHGYPRYTGDLDVFVDANPQNADRIVGAFREFGFDLPQLNAESFIQPNRIVEVGREPVKLQVMTSISGVTFEDCYNRRIDIEIDGLTVPFIGYDDLIRNKRATGRDKDQVDAQQLAKRKK